MMHASYPAEKVAQTSPGAERHPLQKGNFPCAVPCFAPTAGRSPFEGGGAPRRGMLLRGGFTLIEVMVALAVLGTAVFVLLDAHYVALRLFATAEDEVDFRQLLEEAVSRAELGVYDQTYSGGEGFGARYPDYEWSYEAVAAGEEGVETQDAGLYEVTVTVTGPDETRSLTFYVYETGLMDEGPEGLSKDGASTSSGSSSGRRRADARSGAT